MISKLSNISRLRLRFRLENILSACNLSLVDKLIKIGITGIGKIIHSFDEHLIVDAYNKSLTF